MDEDGVLVIRSVDGSSEGMYECRASNSLPDGTFIGSDNSQTMLSTISECGDVCVCGGGTERGGGGTCCIGLQIYCYRTSL